MLAALFGLFGKGRLDRGRRSSRINVVLWLPHGQELGTCLRGQALSCLECRITRRRGTAHPQLHGFKIGIGKDTRNAHVKQGSQNGFTRNRIDLDWVTASLAQGGGGLVVKVDLVAKIAGSKRNRFPNRRRRRVIVISSHEGSCPLGFGL